MMDDRELHGTCGCDRPDCVTARAVRGAAARACVAAVVAEYGSSRHEHDDDFPLWSYPANEWACRAFPYRSDRPCPGCGYVPARAPGWAVHGVVFGLRGKTYRVVSVGSTSRHSPQGLHYEDTVVAELVSGERWSLPEMPAAVEDVSRALRVLFDDLPRFRRPELERALVVCSESLGGAS